jgi:hypothetical protein
VVQPCGQGAFCGDATHHVTTDDQKALFSKAKQSIKSSISRKPSINTLKTELNTAFNGFNASPCDTAALKQTGRIAIIPIIADFRSEAAQFSSKSALPKRDWSNPGTLIETSSARSKAKKEIKASGADDQPNKANAYANALEGLKSDILT